MGRPKRVLFCDRVVHIYSHTLPEIHLTHADRELLHQVIRTYTQKNDYTTYYSTLLGNHFHQLNQCYVQINSSKQPQVLKQEMSRAYNRRHGRKGTIWWDRYDDVTIMKEEQLWKSLVYLACNQARAGMVKSPLLEEFSSMGAYLGEGDDGISTLLPQYEDLGETRQERRDAFREMVLEAMEIYQDADAYARAEGQKRPRRLDESWVRDLHKLEEHERKHLKKREEALIIVVTAKGQEAPAGEGEAKDLPEEVRDAVEGDGILLSPEDVDALIRKGVPRRIIRLFFAPMEDILHMVRHHYKTYRLHAPP